MTYPDSLYAATAADAVLSPLLPSLDLRPLVRQTRLLSQEVLLRGGRPPPRDLDAQPGNLLQDEIGVEAFYNFALTPWLQLTADFQWVRSGKTDILIGTHRLLQKDISFRDLGLLIIDEEQRFGVKQKEVLKKYRALVDVLALTATPIPRTLSMTVYGDLDISIIDELPNKVPFVVMASSSIPHSTAMSII